MTEEEKKKIISEHYRNLGKKGGASTYKKYGREWMSKIGKIPDKVKRVRRTKEQIENG